MPYLGRKDQQCQGKVYRILCTEFCICDTSFVGLGVHCNYKLYSVSMSDLFALSNVLFQAFDDIAWQLHAAMFCITHVIVYYFIDTHLCYFSSVHFCDVLFYIVYHSITMYIAFDVSCTCLSYLHNCFFYRAQQQFHLLICSLNCFAQFIFAMYIQLCLFDFLHLITSRHYRSLSS